MGKSTASIFLLSLFVISQTSWAQVGDWKPELLPPPQNEFRSPTDEFRIFIPPIVPVEVLQNLSLELDGIDVTAMVSREGDYAIFVPPKPLKWGDHTLSIVEYASDGSIMERGLWAFEVRKSARFREAEFQSGIDVKATNRVADQNLDNLPKSTQAQGGLGMGGAIGDENWRVSGNIDFLYNSISDQTPNDREFDMGEYLFTGKVGPLQSDIGHQAIEPVSLVMENFNRRGISASIFPKSPQAKMTAFVMRTERIIGFQHGLGINDPEKRVTGVVGSSNPFSGNPEMLFLSGTYLNGEGEQVGVGESGYTESSAGDAWSLTADSSIFNRRLRLRGEYAATRFDFDGKDTGFDDERDHAYSLLSVYTHPEKTFRGKPLNWNIGLAYQNVGTFFKSLANPGLPNDKRVISTFAEISWSDLSINAYFGSGNDNVDSDPLLPKIQTDQVTVSTTYTPFQEASPKGGWNLFGQPSYQLSLSQTKQNQTHTPIDFSGTVTDNRTQGLGLSASFNPGAWNWSITHAVTLFDDYSDVSSDTRNNFTNLSAGFQVGGRLSIMPNLQYNVFEDKDTDVDTTSLSAGLGVTFPLYRDRLSCALNYSLNQNSASDDSTDTTTSTFDGSMVWAIKPPKNNRPGVNLFVEGNYQDINDKITPGYSTHNYQVFIGVSVSWPIAY